MRRLTRAWNLRGDVVKKNRLLAKLITPMKKEHPPDNDTLPERVLDAMDRALDERKKSTEA